MLTNINIKKKIAYFIYIYVGRGNAKDNFQGDAASSSKNGCVRGDVACDRSGDGSLSMRAAKLNSATSS